MMNNFNKNILIILIFFYNENELNKYYIFINFYFNIL